MTTKNKKQWVRQLSLGGFGAGQDVEVWKCLDSKARTLRQYSIDVYTGKPVDFLSFKPSDAKDFTKEIKAMRRRQAKLFKGRKISIDRCPICRASIKREDLKLVVYGGQYYQCRACTHVFIANRPSEKEIRDFYAHNTQYHSIYVDKKILEARVKEISIPKAKWVIAQYKKQYGRLPRSILDIGAGGGHFVHACRKLGVKAEGVEPSDSSRDFCKKNFGFELIDRDIAKNIKDLRGYDIVTFWGVIEHVADPCVLLSAARKILGRGEKLIVCEVPHWNSMSTVLQIASPDVVARHLDPEGHINCFTEKSLLSTYEQCGFAPVAAWYYGMDHYELMMQMLYKLKDNRVANILSKTLNECQAVYDRGRLSDFVVFAAKPTK